MFCSAAASIKFKLTSFTSSCTKCKTKITQGHTFCQGCAYKNDGMKRFNAS